MPLRGCARQSRPVFDLGNHTLVAVTALDKRGAGADQGSRRRGVRTARRRRAHGLWRRRRSRDGDAAERSRYPSDRDADPHAGDEAIAENALVTLDDFPPVWARSAGSAPLKLRCDAVAAARRRASGIAESPTFVMGANAQAVTGMLIFADERAAGRAFDAISGRDTRRCWARKVSKSVSGIEGARLRKVKITRLAVRPSADRRAAARITVASHRQRQRRRPLRRPGVRPRRSRSLARRVRRRADPLRRGTSRRPDRRPGPPALRRARMKRARPREGHVNAGTHLATGGSVQVAPRGSTTPPTTSTYLT